MSTARSAIRQSIVRLMGEVLTGVPDSNLAVNTFGCAALAVYESDYFNDWRGRFYAGTHKDTNFTGTDFVKSAGVMTFLPALSTAVVASDLFEMYPETSAFTADEINNAINLAISMVEKEALQDKVDVSLTVVANTFEYAIPAGFVYIGEIFQEGGTANRYSPSAGFIPAHYWRILHGTTPKVWFDDSYVSLTTGRKLRLVGQQVQAQLSTDAATCDINPTFLVWQAKAFLHASKIGGTDTEGHNGKMNAALAIAAMERRHIQVAGRGSAV